jgi:hypothetical protein
MRFTNLRLARWLGGILLTLAALPVPAAEAPFSEVIRLVRSMRRDELSLLDLKQNFAVQASKAGDSSDRPECVNQMRYPAITDAVALAITSRLTGAEVQQAIKFYRSEAGRKLTERRYIERRDQSPPGDMSYLTAVEKSQLAAFRKTSAGRKLEQQDIGTDQTSMERILMRGQLQLSDCAEDALRAKDPSRLRTLCASLPVAGPTNLCAAQYSTVEGLRDAPQTVVEVSCALGQRGGGIVAAYRGAVKEIDFLWRDDTTLAVILPRGARSIGQQAVDELKSPLKFEYRSRRKGDAAGLMCVPAVAAPTGSRPELNEIESQPHWMAYSGEDYCLISRRLAGRELGGFPQDATLQFRQQRKAELPLGTTELVLLETHSKNARIRSVDLLTPNAPNTAMTAGGRILGFRLAGANAEQALERWASGANLALQYQPASGDAITVPLQRTDLAWALQEFNACRRELEKSGVAR